MAPVNIQNGHDHKEGQKILDHDTLNPYLRDFNIGSLIPLMNRARELGEDLHKGVKKPFTEVIAGFLGDHQAMGQNPITFIRQVLAIITYPALLDDPRFPEDVKERARTLLGFFAGGSVGAYTINSGNVDIRRRVADYIANRDGYRSDWADITLSDGATDGVQAVLTMMSTGGDGARPGVMVPVPQYPLYSVALAGLNIRQIDYYLDEGNNWGLDVKELKRAIDEARKHCIPRAIVVINPGNPTGQVLSKDNIQEIIKFAYAERLFILADEVYQDNVYAKGSQFHSFKKIINEMGSPYSQMELASFMSVSKGYMGECGLRGGYTELINVLPEVRSTHFKALAPMTCPTTIGQAVMDCVVQPPRPGDASYEKFHSEKTAVLRSLAERAKTVADAFNGMEGISCNEVQGAMYAFPQIQFPPNAIAAAKKAGQSPDELYTFALLEQTGICISPGCFFGQLAGTYHVRTTILPQPGQLKIMMDKFKKFHQKFLEEYK